MSTTTSIHPTAVVENDVELDSGVVIGPYSVVKGRVRIGKNTVINSHVTIGSSSTVVSIGENNNFLPGAMVGGPPQDLSYKNDPTKLEIGNHNIFREFVTINCGTVKGGGVTRIGNHCMLMSYVHVAHDCQIGDHVVVANGCQFAGHVTVEEHVHIGGMCGIVQFARVGRFAYVGGASHIRKDVLPYTIAEGSEMARCRATNKIGLQRAGYSKDEIENIARAIRFIVVGDRTLEESLQKITGECKASDHIRHLINFIENSKFGVAR